MALTPPPVVVEAGIVSAAGSVKGSVKKPTIIEADVPVSSKSEEPPVGGEVQAVEKDVTAKSKTGKIKLEHFDGNTPIEAYLIKFETAARHNGWSDEDKLSQMTCLLRGGCKPITGMLALRPRDQLTSSEFGPVISLGISH